ncbi:MAG: hypothetical protein HQL06_04345 [Nitrospirae bacterium]|nr:hypothetical protein [Nitrospirota bacterium]
MRRVLVLLLFVLLSCGKDEVKVTPEESKITASAIDVVEKIRQLYQSRDKAGLKTLTTPEAYLGHFSATKDFDTASLKFKPQWVDVKDSTIHVNVVWTGVWKKGGGITNEKGICTFVLLRQPVKLTQILRESPFIYPD